MCTKLDARICLWTPFLCAKCQGDWSTRLYFIAIFASVRKEERKTTSETLAVHISEMAKAISFKFEMYTLLAGGQLCSKCGFNRARDH